jgi:hypothetical protein
MVGQQRPLLGVALVSISNAIPALLLRDQQSQAAPHNKSAKRMGL